LHQIKINPSKGPNVAADKNLTTSLEDGVSYSLRPKNDVSSLSKVGCI